MYIGLSELGSVVAIEEGVVVIRGCTANTIAATRQPLLPAPRIIWNSLWCGAWVALCAVAYHEV